MEDPFESLETDEANLYRALASTPQQLSEGLELVRGVLGKDIRDLGEMIDADEADKAWLQPRLYEYRVRLLSLAALTQIAFDQVTPVAVHLCGHMRVTDGAATDDAAKPNGVTDHIEAASPGEAASP